MTNSTAPKRAAVYVRVSRLDQHPDNQVPELRRYCKARGWVGTEFIERGVSGSKERRPALDVMLAAVRRRKFDVVVCLKMDRLGRSLSHLVTLLDELRALNVEFATVGEGIDTTTPAGKLQMHILAAIAEFERDRLRERTLAGLDRARAEGKTLGRRPNTALRRQLGGVAHLSVRKAAAILKCSPVTVQKLRVAERTSGFSFSDDATTQTSRRRPAVLPPSRSARRNDRRKKLTVAQSKARAMKATLRLRPPRTQRKAREEGRGLER